VYTLPPGLEREREPIITGLSCPDCDGVLEVSAVGRASALHFACRTGHTFALGELFAAKEERLETRLWTAYTAFEELVQLLHDLGERRPRSEVDAGHTTRLDRATALSHRLRAIIEENSPGRSGAPGPARRRRLRGRGRRRVINAEQVRGDVIVIGGSAGAVSAMMDLLALLPRDLPAAVCVVLQRSPAVESHLPLVLGRRTPLGVLEPQAVRLLGHGVVYVAPRDHHMVVNDGRIGLNRGPKEHRTRPAIDPLFRTAAEFHGRRIVGVLLSGLGADGTTGLSHIKTARGLCLVRHPGQAQFSTMPSNAIAKDEWMASWRWQTSPRRWPSLPRAGWSFPRRGP
jgi:two-component system chemotaxis response regulator CheB